MTAPFPLTARGSAPHPQPNHTSKRPPLIAEVTSTLADGLYGPGHEIEILVRYTAPVVVYGTPRLWLDLGDADDYAECTALKAGTDDTLAFVYIVVEGMCARPRAQFLLQLSMIPTG